MENSKRKKGRIKNKERCKEEQNEEMKACRESEGEAKREGRLLDIKRGIQGNISPEVKERLQ